MISAMLFTAQILSNVSKATVIEQKSTVKLYSKGELICLVYNGIKIGTQFVVYEKDGKPGTIDLIEDDLVFIEQWLLCVFCHEGEFVD